MSAAADDYASYRADVAAVAGPAEGDVTDGGEQIGHTCARPVYMLGADLHLPGVSVILARR